MTRFEPALFVAGGLIVVAVVLMTPWEVLWRRVTSRIAVEVVRLRTRHAGKHTETRRQTADRDSAWAKQLAAINADLDPLPPQVGNYRDPLREHIDAAWAVTGMTQAEYWATVAPPSDLPGPALTILCPACDAGTSPQEPCTCFLPGGRRAGEPTPAQRQLLWQPNDVIPPRIAATLARAQADQTVIDSDLTPETRAALVEQFAGGDPYNGEGERWFDAFDRIEARAHERLQQARAELDRWFTPVGAR